jgi:ABC-type nitrate/sulfonate/bicarbonate transport system substrate-binding protein
VGYDGSPLLGPLYRALEGSPAAGATWKAVRLGSGGDVGYALLAGEVDVGFVAADRALRLLDTPGGADLAAAGAVTFPYGATLVIRKDRSLRLSDLPGRRVAALEAGCRLLHQFKADARRLGVDASRIRFAYMPFSDMTPALEAGAVEGAVLKGAYAVLAELAGHKVLYQNWELKPGDECCHDALAQVEHLLVARRAVAGRLGPLVADLAGASERPPAELRRAVARETGYPLAALEGFPQASFTPVTDDLRRELGAKALGPAP